MSDGINVVEEAFRVCGEDKGKTPVKTCLALERGDFGAMLAALPGCGGVEMGKRRTRKSMSWSAFGAERGGNQ